MQRRPDGRWTRTDRFPGAVVALSEGLYSQLKQQNAALQCKLADNVKDMD